MTNPVRVLVGVSRCLLGEEVRFDRGHKRSRYVTDVLSAFFEYLPVCPEVEVGMGVPRESVRLVEVDAGPPRLIAPRSGTDWTPAMESLLAERVEAIAAAAPRGFIVKSKSPTCGLDRVRVYRAAGPPAADGVGMFTAALQARLPLLPIEDEGRLNDARLREHFITRVFAHDDWLRLLEAPSAAALVAFHARHKMLLMAHHPAGYRALGPIVADLAEPGERPRREPGEAASAARREPEGVAALRRAVRNAADEGASPGAAGDFPRVLPGAGRLDAALAEYGRRFMQTLAHPPSPGRHVNVMQHLAGYVRADLDADDRRELAAVLAEYRAGRVPHEVPMTLLRHHLRRGGHPWANAQSYLWPHPPVLALRSHL